MESLDLKVTGQQVILYSSKALYLKKYDSLLIADLHFGKVGHFRRAGIAVPPQVARSNWELLIELMQQVNPSKVVFLGDLFHSHHNPEWEEFRNIISHFPASKFELVKGNHDIMSDHQYKKAGVTIHNDSLFLDPFLLSHIPEDSISSHHYNLAGHIHPGIRLKGKGRQSELLPCFWFGKHRGLMPAFGKFTGLKRIKPDRSDTLIGILDDQLVDFSK